MPQKRLATVITEIIDESPEVKEEIETSTLEDYKKLNDKCDVVINKIKTRKGKKNSKKLGNNA